MGGSRTNMHQCFQIKQDDSSNQLWRMNFARPICYKYKPYYHCEPLSQKISDFKFNVSWLRIYLTSGRLLTKQQLGRNELRYIRTGLD